MMPTNQAEVTMVDTHDLICLGTASHPSVVFAGKDPSRALAMSSLKPEDCTPDWVDLDDSQKTVLSEWYTFFSKRYNIVGKVSIKATS